MYVHLRRVRRIQIDNLQGTAYCHCLRLPSALLFWNGTPDNIEYGEAILVAFKLKAERQLEVIAADQQDNLLVLCRLMLDIQAVQGNLVRERWRLSVCR